MSKYFYGKLYLNFMGGGGGGGHKYYHQYQ